MLRNLGVFFCRLGTTLYLGLHVYQAKSWVYRWIFERKYRKVEVPVYTKLGDLVAFIKKLIWTADSWEQGFDAFSYVGKVQYVGTDGDRHVGDCDEFALYNATAIKKANAAGTIKEYWNPRILTVCWMEKDGTLGGHNVCLLDWHNGTAYMDYDYPNLFNDLPATVKGVLSSYGGKDAVCLGWGITDPETLKPLEVHWR